MKQLNGSPPSRTAMSLPALLRGSTGLVVEIGPGSAGNLQHVPTGTEWVGVEPDVRRHAQIQRRAGGLGRPARVVAGRAERLELEDQSVDVVVGTFVLCSVAAPTTALSEIRRVLRPGGRYVFAEHIAAPAGTWTRRAEQAWTALTCWSDSGCRADRETDVAIGDAGFDTLDLRRYQVPGPVRTRVAHITGVARTRSVPNLPKPVTNPHPYQGA